MGYKLLIINPGSTSTKIAVYDDEKPLFIETLRHSTQEINSYPSIYEQKDFRKNIILSVLEEKGIGIKDMDAVVGRGGLVKPLAGGTYAVNEHMLEDLKEGVQGQHASNLGGIIAKLLADEVNIPAYIVDPVVVDELQDVSRLTGMPQLPKRCIFHALNQKAVARRYALENNKRYEDINLIVAHMGGGVSVGAHCKGRIIDVNNGLLGEGPFSPERVGTIPAMDLAKLCFSGEYSEKQMNKMLCGKGGIVAYLGTNDMREAESKASQDEEAKTVVDAFSYNIAKAIGQYAISLRGQAEAIILTGGIAYSRTITKAISDYVEWIAPVVIYPGEDEMLALAQGGLRCLKGEEEPKEYR